MPFFTVIMMVSLSASGLLSTDGLFWLFLGTMPATFHHWYYCYYVGLFSFGLRAGGQLWIVPGHTASYLSLLFIAMPFSALVGNWGWFLGMCYSPSVIIVITAVPFSALVSLVDSCGWFLGMKLAILHCYYSGDLFSSGLSAGRQLLLVPGHDAVHLSLLFTVLSIFHGYLQCCPSFIVIYSSVHLSLVFTMVSIFHCYLQWCPSFIAVTMVTFSALASALVGNWGWFLGMMLSMVLFIGLIIFFIILFKRGKRFKQRDSPSNSFYGGDAASYSGTYADSKLSVQLPVLCFFHSGLACPALSLPTPVFCSHVHRWASPLWQLLGTG